MFEIMLGLTIPKNLPSHCDFTVKAGDENLGYVGIIKAECFIGGEELATLCGVNFGVSHRPDDGWLTYTVNGKMVYYAANALRTNTNLKRLDQLGLRYGKEVVINEKRYSVRFIKLSEITTLFKPVIQGQTAVANKWDGIPLGDLMVGTITSTCQEAVGAMVRVAVDTRQLPNINSALNWTNHTTYDVASPPAYQSWRPLIEEL